MVGQSEETIAKGMIRIIALEAEIRALQARGDALAAAVEQLNEYDLEVGVFIQRAQDAARAWRESRQ